MRKRQISEDHLKYLASLATDPEQVISRVYSMDGAALYKVTDEHYVCVACVGSNCNHKGRVLLERVLPRDWECFSSAVNPDEGYEVYHYGPPT